jgi:hypothetical protein
MYQIAQPFLPRGTTSKIAADTTAPAGLRLAGDTNTTDPMAFMQYRVANGGTETIYFFYASTNTAAQTGAVIPTNATVGGAHPLPAGAVEVITAPTGQFWSGITATAAQSLFITPGKGV